MGGQNYKYTEESDLQKEENSTTKQRNVEIRDHVVQEHIVSSVPDKFPILLKSNYFSFL